MNITSLKTKLYTILILVISLNIVGQIEKKINIINSTFLGGEGRNYYGNTAPEKLNIKFLSPENALPSDSEIDLSSLFRNPLSALK